MSFLFFLQQIAFIVEDDGWECLMPNSRVSSENMSHCIIFKKLTPTELNDNMSNQEFLDVKLELEEWCIWLEREQHLFQVYSDHLEYLKSAKHLTPCYAIWELLSSCFQFTISD